jgi:diketogulonate reductase-like aldo/keto reductase
MSVPEIELNDGHSIPQLGFGVFQIEPEETSRAVSVALEVGYRHIDTAEMYGNERGVGEAIRASGLDRGDIYVTSKLNNSFHRPDDARPAFDRTLSELGFDYVDLFLIHWPLPTLYDGDFVSTWKTLEEFKAGGGARSIGRTPAQVVLRWQVQHGNVVFPKSVTPERIRENFEIFDFELESRDIEQIDGLDRGEDGRTGPHPDQFAYVPD